MVLQVFILGLAFCLAFHVLLHVPVQSFTVFNFANKIFTENSATHVLWYTLFGDIEVVTGRITIDVTAPLLH